MTEVVFKYLQSIMVKRIRKNPYFILCCNINRRVRLSVYRVNGNENRFLREFVGCVPHSAGCRLARWLQPESVVEPDSCELSLSTAEVRCGWPAKITVRMRDQYGNLVQSAGLKVKWFRFTFPRVTLVV